MNIKKVSSKAILTRIESLGLSGTGWHGEALEAIGDAIRGIGYHLGFKTEKGMKIKVSNFKAFLPSCLETLDEVKLDGCPLVLVYDRDNVCCNAPKSPANYSDIVEYNEIIDNINKLRQKIEQESTSENPDYEALEAMSSELNKAHNLVSTFGTLNSNYSFYKGGWFTVEDNVLTVNFSEGELEIDGQIYDLDEEGYPYIVDTFKYQTAVYWYVLYQLLLGEYDHPKITWQQAFQMWEDYRQRAANEPKILDSNQNDRFVRRWNSITRDNREIYRR